MSAGAFQRYYASPAFQELRVAQRARDFARVAQIMQTQIASTSGGERAFWLVLQYEKRRDTYAPRDLHKLWPDLAGILATGPNDPDVIYSVALKAFQLYWFSERPGKLGTMLPPFRPCRHGFQSDFYMRQFLGGLAQKKRRWYSAYRHYDLSIRAFYALSGAHRESASGHLHYLHAYKAYTAAILGRLPEAKAEVAASKAVAATRPARYFEPYPLALAEAIIAYVERRYHDARGALHLANAVPSDYKRRPSADVDFLLMAARIARAEGNMRGFDHFCEQAHALCTDHDMPLTKAAVLAVVSGAEF
jgi:hypothetical protein